MACTLMAPVRSAACVLLFAWGCGEAELGVARDAPPEPRAPAFTFRDVTAQAGLLHELSHSAQAPRRIVEVKGSGVGLLDYENDGDLDVLALDSATLEAPEAGAGTRLFENRGHMRFADVTADAGLEFRRWAMGVAVGDVNGDGFDDAYVSVFGRDGMLMNVARDTPGTGPGARGLVERTPAELGHPGWSTGCAFGDLDRDGDLDLYVACYLELDLKAPAGRATFLGVDVFAGPSGLTPQPDVLYENTGAGVFRDVTEAAGCASVPASYGLGALILDLDEDGLPEIFVGNDSGRNFLFENQTDGPLRFEERALAAGLAVNADGNTQATMGIAVGDVNGNGLPDLFSTNFSSDTNTLHVNHGALRFADRTQLRGLGQVSQPYLGWASAFFDFDHDGDEDLVAFNGHVYPENITGQLGEDRAQVPLLFERGEQRFTRVRASATDHWLARPYCDRGAAFGDLDRDGDVDVVVRTSAGPLRLLRNIGASERGGRGLIVALEDPHRPNHRGLGARITLVSTAGRATRWIVSGGSYLSASAQEAHFGVAQGERAEEFIVRWPDGQEQRVPVQAQRDLQVIRRAPSPR